MKLEEREGKRVDEVEEGRQKEVDEERVGRGWINKRRESSMQARARRLSEL